MQQHKELQPPPNIYVVDDLIGVTDVVSMVLKTVGYRTVVFNDPVAAYEEFAAADPKPALLITDFGMPGMNGMELIQRCKAASPGLKTLSYSGMLTADDLAGYAVKPDRILRKPSTMRALAEAVEQLLKVAGRGQLGLRGRTRPRIEGCRLSVWGLGSARRRVTQLSREERHGRPEANRPR